MYSPAALTEGNFTAAMVGGMIPPLAIATAMIFFKRKFTQRTTWFYRAKLCDGLIIHH